MVVAELGREEEVARVFRRWGLEVSTVGEVTDHGRAVIAHRGSSWISSWVTEPSWGFESAPGAALIATPCVLR